MVLDIHQVMESRKIQRNLRFLGMRVEPALKACAIRLIHLSPTGRKGPVLIVETEY